MQTRIMNFSNSLLLLLITAKFVNLCIIEHLILYFIFCRIQILKLLMYTLLFAINTNFMSNRQCYFWGNYYFWGCKIFSGASHRKTCWCSLFCSSAVLKRRRFYCWWHPLGVSWFPRWWIFSNLPGPIYLVGCLEISLQIGILLASF